MIRAYQGIDIVTADRLRRVSRRHDRFLAEVFSESERGYCLAQADPFIHFAGRFAAKEACMKALGLGLAESGAGGVFSDIEVVRHPSGRPSLSLTGWVETLAARRRVRQSSVSISHTGRFAVAAVLLLADSGEEE